MSISDFWTAIAAMCGVMLVCVAVTALAEKKLGKKSWERLMALLEGRRR